MSSTEIIHQLRKEYGEEVLNITELPQAQDFLNVPGQVNYVMATLKNREKIYDARDVDATTEQIRRVGDKIQAQLGFDYLITLPKMSQLEMSNYTNMAMEIMMLFIVLKSIRKKSTRSLPI